ncbi:hypothetical protein BDN70DRAFT_854910 [Pholiota conissans]|uniref:Uncharacterized protein n=1 Tax=Pholiota conissans TaxID=109636 RepID=A0A9P5Z5M6_9AGAR|nr:hypothetical protein BDN70DRAFT_854910 [Pholiota conissans]
MGEFDGEIGRGRQRGSGDDSSSSRESSKERPASSHRIASPAHTDDGDTRMETTADDDTPPPQTRPIIRQAVGFSSDKPPASINTYEAVPETVPKQAYFLPGQIVTQPKPVKTKKPRVKRTDAYPGQQTRFRVGTYDPTPTADPPLDHGSGPYSSMYRGVSGGLPKDSRRFEDSSSTAKGKAPNSLVPLSNASNPTRTRSTESHSSTASRSQPIQQAPPPISRTQNAKSKSSQLGYQQTHQHPPNYSHHQPLLPPPPPPPPSSYYPPTSSAYHGSSSLPPPASPLHYRQDYQSSSREQRERDYQQSYSGPRPSHDAQSDDGKRPGPLRIVTLLIRDTRNGTVDHQLAEVKVHLKQFDTPDGGFWADSKDIAHYLQRGPSRIDGPARAYVLRGKYRQFILRVTADNQDEFMTANVNISPERTLDIVVEMLPPPGGPPLVPVIPTDLLTPSYEESRSGSHSMDVDIQSPPPPTPPPPPPPAPPRDARKRANSPSFDDYDTQRGGPQSHPGPINKTPRHSYSRHYSPGRSPRHASPHYTGAPGGSTVSDGRTSNRRQSLTMDTTPSQNQYTYPMPPVRQSPRPAPPSPPDAPMHTLRPIQSDHEDSSMSPEPDESFISAVDNLLQEDSAAWTAFYKAKAGNKIADVLKQYEFVRQKCKALRGKTIPGFTQTITDEHIVRALKIEEKNYLQMCNKTMDLMMLYGKQGRYYEDPRIEDVINDSESPKYGSNPYKRILHFLEDIDKAWHNGKTEPRQRPQQPRSPTLPLQPPVRAGSHYDSDSMPQRSRTSKALFTQ